MQGDRDLAATQLLMSHLCHELVSPIGAVNNGIEMLQDFDGDAMAPEAVALIAESGKAAAAKLRFYRLAYGRAGQAGDLGLPQCAAAASELLAADGRVRLEWDAAAAARLIAGGPQLILNLVVLAATALPRGGRVAVTIGERGPARLAAEGVGAKLSEAVHAVVLGREVPLDHGNIHAWYCHRLAARLGGAVAVATAADAVRFEIDIERLVD
jgi:histidine phosphotransferase ChpT